LADDITQAFFITLSKRAKSLHDPNLLTGWLVRTTRSASLNALKYQSRRRHHEQQAAAMQSMTVANEDCLSNVAPLLDEALAHLNLKDRSAIALRYFQGKTARDVGLYLGISEPAAQKRITRALERL